MITSINYKLILILAILQIVFIYALSVPTFQSALAIICWAYLIFVFFTKGTQDALYVLTIIGILSFDQASFVFEDKESQLVNFFAIPILGMYPFIFISVLLFLKSLKNIKSVKQRRQQMGAYNNIDLCILYVLVFIVISLIVCIMNLCIGIYNDNAFRYDLFRFLVILLYIPIYGFYISEKQIADKYVSLIFNFLIVSGITILFSITSGHIGHYGVDREIVPLAPLYTVFSTALISFHSSLKGRYKQFYLYAVLNVMLTVLFSNALGGKAWIILCMSLLYVAVNVVRSTYGIALAVVLSIVLINVEPLDLLQADTVSSDKFEEFVSAINVFDPNWYNSMSGSPKYRIDEFINVFIEYQENPVYLLFGKGLGGCVSDHTQTFGFFNSAAFDDMQYIKKQFYSLHESINVIFLKFGILGLLSFFILIYKLFRDTIKYKEPCLLIGSFWFLFFVSYSYELMFFGIPCLICGLYNTVKKSYV